MIGRNGSGKSSLLRVLSGELPPDWPDVVWRAPSLRVSRLDQECQAGSERTVFDEIADGLGVLGALVAALSPRRRQGSGAPARRRRAVSPRAAPAAVGGATTDGGSSRKSSSSSRGSGCPRIARVASCRAGGGAGCCLARRWFRSPMCCCSTSRRTTSTSTPSAGSRSYLRIPARCCSSPTTARFSSALATRIVELDRGRLTSWPGSYATYLEKKAAALDNEARDLERLDKKLAQEEAWLRQGVKARRTRNEGRVKALMALRAERAARRAGDRRRSGWPSTRRSPRASWCSRRRTCQQVVRRRARRSATTRSASCAAIASG